MAIKPIRLLVRRKLDLDLTGPHGTVAFLEDQACRLSDVFGLDCKRILEDMRSGDYENAVQVFDREFGSHVDLYR